MPALWCPQAQGGGGVDNGPSQPPHSPTEELSWPPASQLLPHPLVLASGLAQREQLSPPRCTCSLLPFVRAAVPDLLAIFSPSLVQQSTAALAKHASQ